MNGCSSVFMFTTRYSQEACTHYRTGVFSISAALCLSFPPVVSPQARTSTPSRLRPGRLLHPLHPCTFPLLLSPVVHLLPPLFLHLEWGRLTAPLSRSPGPPDAAGLPNQLQRGAMQRLSLPGRNCAVIEPLDNDTFVSLISYQR